MPAIRGAKSTKKTRRKRRDVDQVYEDLRAARNEYRKSKDVEDLPALGEHYCTECAKWFESERNLTAHRKGKPHKRRLRQLKGEPYSQKEAEAAVGLTTENGRPEKMAVDTQMSDADRKQQRPQANADTYDDQEEYNAFFDHY